MDGNTVTWRFTNWEPDLDIDEYPHSSNIRFGLMGESDWQRVQDAYEDLQADPDDVEALNRVVTVLIGLQAYESHGINREPFLAEIAAAFDQAMAISPETTVLQYLDWMGYTYIHAHGFSELPERYYRVLEQAVILTPEHPKLMTHLGDVRRWMQCGYPVTDSDVDCQRIGDAVTELESALAGERSSSPAPTETPTTTSAPAATAVPAGTSAPLSTSTVTAVGAADGLGAAPEPTSLQPVLPWIVLLPLALGVFVLLGVAYVRRSTRS